MKAVLLAAGKGTRLKPITRDVSKMMIEIGGKPFLEYIIDDLRESGFDEICLIIGHHGDQIKEYFGRGQKFNIKIEYKNQKKYLGTANALSYAKNFVDRQQFLLYLADTIIPDLKKYVYKMSITNSDVDILSSKIPSSEVTKVGTVEIKKGYVTKMHEKSPTPITNLAWAGVAFFKNDLIFRIIDHLQISTRGEYEITDAFNKLTEYARIKNYTCRTFLDSGTPTGMIKVVKHVLKNHRGMTKNKYGRKKNVIEPSYIGRNCVIGENSIIGPFVSLGNSVVVGDNTTIKESLILEQSKIDNDVNIINSIISPSGIIRCK